jgi:hypothetical protein
MAGQPYGDSNEAYVEKVAETGIDGFFDGAHVKGNQRASNNGKKVFLRASFWPVFSYQDGEKKNDPGRDSNEEYEKCEPQ